jgi:hypothetical protein
MRRRGSSGITGFGNDKILNLLTFLTISRDGEDG